MIRLIENKLVDNDSYLIVSFDAWLFQGYDDARAALLETIGNALVSATENNASLHTKAMKLLGRVNKLRALGLSLEVGAFAMGLPAFGAIQAGFSALSRAADHSASSVDMESIKAAGNSAQDQIAGLVKPAPDTSPPEEVQKFRAEFEELLKDLDKTLVVIVDNLDRCLPRDAIRTLEAIRLFLFVKHTAFIIAADEEMIRIAVSEHYGADQTRLVTDYLDKFVQVPVRVPRAGFAEIRAYLIMLLLNEPKDASTKLSTGQLAAINVSLDGHLRSIWKQAAFDGDHLKVAASTAGVLSASQAAGLQHAFGLADRLARPLSRARRVSGNPRTVKRILNTVRMRSDIARMREMPLDEGMIAKLVLFERCTSSATMNALLNMIATSKDGLVAVLGELEEQSARGDAVVVPDDWSRDEEFVLDWITLEPRLGGVDLRPAAYLARETAISELSRSVLSPHSKEALRMLIAASSTTSPSTIKKIESLPPDELEVLMGEVIRHLTQVSDWKKNPPGFDGAIILADRSKHAAADLQTFIRSHIASQPRWLSYLLKNKSWWEDM